MALVIWPFDTDQAFPEFFAEVGQWPKMVSSCRLFVSSPGSDETKPALPLQTRNTPEGFNDRPKITAGVVPELISDQLAGPARAG
jgi:hypothetical protein